MTDLSFHFGAVLGEDGVRFVAVETSAGSLRDAVVGYVASRAPFTLWPSEAAAVSRHLSCGELDQAIDRYFGTVGTRWDREWLITTRLTMPILAGARRESF